MVKGILPRQHCYVLQARPQHITEKDMVILSDRGSDLGWFWFLTGMHHQNDLPRWFNEPCDSQQTNKVQMPDWPVENFQHLWLIKKTLAKPPV